MFKSLKIVGIFLVFTYFIFTCENATGPEKDDHYFKGITETDENGNLIGNFDFDDWTLPNRFFGNKVEIIPHTSLSFYANYKDQEVISYIIFQNFSQDKFEYSFNKISYPFNKDKSSMSLFANGYDSLMVRFVLPDTINSSYKDSLIVTTSGYENVKIILSGSWDDPTDNIFPGTTMSRSYSFLPAYPNPASDSIYFKYSNISRNNVNLKIIDKQNNIIKNLVTNTLQTAGMYQILWDLKDTDGKKVDPSIYRAELDINGFNSHGDILIE